MRRMAAAVLALVTVLLTSCGGSRLVSDTREEGVAARTTTAETNAAQTGEAVGKHDTAGWCAGFGRRDITPDAPVPLAGYGNVMYRISEKVLDPLYATCLALRDEAGETLLIYQMDIINTGSALVEQIRKLVQKELGIDAQHVFVNATHTHSGPATSENTDSITLWKTKFYKAALAAAQDAVADLDTVTELSTGTAETDRLNFVRRYYRENGFTTDNADYGTGEITRHETEADPEMRVVRFARKNQPDIVLTNWQCHPHRTGGSTKTDISADIIGVMRKKAEEGLGIKFLYLQGGAGNINPFSRISGEARFGDYKDIGRELYNTMTEALKNAKQAKTGAIRVAETTFDVEVNHSEDDRVADAQKVTAVLSTNDRNGASTLAKQLGFAGYFEASAVISRAKRDATEPITVNCYAIGDVAFTAAPFEMFCQTEKQLREDSPFAFTVTCGYSNASHGYMPAAECFANKGYEVFQCHYVMGTAEQISAKQMELLNDLFVQ